MRARELGFFSSWHMLTRDKGWIKPLLVLTLVGWVPILGQVALLGYGLEWARLTAWGVDSAPKQSGIDYGKLLTTGIRAFCVTFLFNIAAALLLQIVFPGSLLWLVTGGSGSVISGAMFATYGVAFVVLMVLWALSGTFAMAASLRATLYDDFSAGWRLDRLFQMVGRDLGGFLKTYLISLIGTCVTALYGMVMGFVGAVMVAGAALGSAALAGMSTGHMNGWQALGDFFFGIGAGSALLIVLCVLAVSFVGAVIATAMNLVAINAVGQWFCRFDVNRWGVSAAPLPDDVPHRPDAWAGGVPVNPMPSTPASPAPASPAPAEGAAEGAAAPVASEPSDPVDAMRAAPAPAPVASTAPASETPVAGPDVPVEPVPESHASTAGAQADAVAPIEGPSVSALEPTAPVEDVRVEPAPESFADEGEVDGLSGDAGEARDGQKRPIPLGPITSHDDEGEEEGPIIV